MNREFSPRLGGWIFLLVAWPIEAPAETLLPLEHADVTVLGARALDEVLNAKAAGNANAVAGATNADRLGHPVSGVGDVHCDGYDAVLIGGIPALRDTIEFSALRKRGVTILVG